MIILPKNFITKLFIRFSQFLRAHDLNICIVTIYFRNLFSQILLHIILWLCLKNTDRSSCAAVFDKFSENVHKIHEKILQWSPFSNYNFNNTGLHVRCFSKQLFCRTPEAYSEPCQTSKMERFTKIVKAFCHSLFSQNAPS